MDKLICRISSLNSPLECHNRPSEGYRVCDVLCDRVRELTEEQPKEEHEIKPKRWR